MLGTPHKPRLVKPSRGHISLQSLDLSRPHPASHLASEL